MIEVEKKFLLKDGDRERLIAGAQFLGERVMVDLHFDNATYDLTRKNWWLRQRNGRFELKLPMDKGTDGQDKAALVDQYEEVTDDETIRDLLKLETAGTLAEALARAGIEPFSKFTSHRKKYQSGQFTIDLDEADFGYRIGEVELMVASRAEIQGAVDEILKFAEAKGLTIAPVRGKTIEYLRRHRPDHYQALVDSGVLPGL